jgi:hypothetical protein
MANIILKEQNGNPVTYEDVRQISATADTGVTKKFTDLDNVYAYYASFDNGKYLMKRRIPLSFKGDDGVILFVSEQEVAEFGAPTASDPNVHILELVFSANILREGSSYSYNYICGEAHE